VDEAWPCERRDELSRSTREEVSDFFVVDSRPKERDVLGQLYAQRGGAKPVEEPPASSQWRNPRARETGNTHIRKRDSWVSSLRMLTRPNALRRRQ
jgi:hypothetical protein